MPVTRPGRRIVGPEDVIKDAEETFPEGCFERPKVDAEAPLRNLTYKERLQRRLKMADMALEKYEKRLESGGYLEPEEERLFLAHQDSVRKLETTLAQLESRDNSTEEMTDLELAMDMMSRGMEKANVLRVFSHNPELGRQLEDALWDKNERGKYE